MFYFTRFCLAAAVMLFGLNFYGLAIPYDYRESFDKELLSYEDALEQMDAVYEKYGASEEFFRKSVKIYESSINYVWPKEIAQIPLRNNYILSLASFFDNILYKLKLVGIADTFTVFESIKYERGFQRGFGICSQNALGLVDIFDRRYGIKAHMIGLDGHVVMSAITSPEQKEYILDPSLGLFLPFTLAYAEQNLSEVLQYYQHTSHESLFEKYNSAGNVRFAEEGAAAFRPKTALFEKAADILIWAIPFGLLLISIYTYRKETLVKR
jgi:hypothetical protein